MLRHQEVSFHLYLIFLIFFSQKTYPSVKRGHTSTILYLAYMVQHLLTFILCSLCSSVKKNMSFCQKRVYAPNHSLSGVYGPVASNLRVHMAAENFPASA